LYAHNYLLVITCCLVMMSYLHPPAGCYPHTQYTQCVQHNASYLHTAIIPAIITSSIYTAFLCSAVLNICLVHPVLFRCLSILALSQSLLCHCVHLLATLQTSATYHAPILLLFFYSKRPLVVNISIYAFFLHKTNRILNKLNRYIVATK